MKLKKDKKHTVWAEYELKGKVKSLRQILYKAVNIGKIWIGAAIDYDYSFSRDHFDLYNLYIRVNKKGKLVEYNKYNADDSLDTKYTYKYDKKGSLIEGETNEYPEDVDRYRIGYRKSMYKYDKKGNEIEENNYWYRVDGSLDSKQTYKYDEKGNKIEENKYWYRVDGSLNSKETYKYDEDGNKIEENKYWYRVDGSLYRKYTWSLEDDIKNMI